MKLSVLAAVAACGLALAGCASIIKGPSQSIAITTPPTSGAQCTLSSREGNWIVISPGIVTIEKSKEDILARCVKPGWQDGVATIPSDFQAWSLGNAVAGGLIGLGVDAATGAINEYPNAFQIPMMPGKSSLADDGMTSVADSGNARVTYVPPPPVVQPPPPAPTAEDGMAALKRKDYPAALAAWTPLAEQGNPVAANGIGFLYQHGYGVPQDSKRAVEWYRAAARAGSDKAGANLGWMYGSGDGVQRDLVLSYMWYDIAVTASAGSNSTARQSLDHLGKMISDSDRTKAKRLADGCRKSGFAECGG